MFIDRICCGCAVFVLCVAQFDCAAMDDGGQFWFFWGSSFHDHHERFTFANAGAILMHPKFRVNLPTVVYIHGLNESPLVESVQVIVNAYLQHGGYNTLILDWSQSAAAMYPVAVMNVQKLGSRLARVFVKLFMRGLSIDTFHLVGHSLGAQMSGQIGREIVRNTGKKIILPRISALDAAGPLYYPGIMMPHISATDAKMVDVIHTDAGFLGAVINTGTVDFWPNSGHRFQPGCAVGLTMMLSEADRCSHSYSWRLWAESVLSSDDSNAFRSVRAASWYAFEDGHIDRSQTIQLGVKCPFGSTGTWFLQTNSETPLSRGAEGIDYNPIVDNNGI